MSLKEQLEAEIKDCRFHADLMSRDSWTGECPVRLVSPLE